LSLQSQHKTDLKNNIFFLYLKCYPKMSYSGSKAQNLKIKRMFLPCQVSERNFDHTKVKCQIQCTLDFMFWIFNYFNDRICHSLDDQVNWLGMKKSILFFTEYYMKTVI